MSVTTDIRLADKRLSTESSERHKIAPKAQCAFPVAIYIYRRCAAVVAQTPRQKNSGFASRDEHARWHILMYASGDLDPNKQTARVVRHCWLITLTHGTEGRQERWANFPRNTPLQRGYPLGKMFAIGFKIALNEVQWCLDRVWYVHSRIFFTRRYC